MYKQIYCISLLATRKFSVASTIYDFFLVFFLGFLFLVFFSHSNEKKTSKQKLAKITENQEITIKKNRVKNNELNRKLDVKLYYRLITMTEPGLKVSNNTNRHTCFASYGAAAQFALYFLSFFQKNIKNIRERRAIIFHLAFFSARQ